MVTYRKVRFTSKEHGSTAGLVLTDEHFPVVLTAVSRLFPVSEFRKMELFQQSPPFQTWDEAFNYQFSES